MGDDGDNTVYKLGMYVQVSDAYDYWRRDIERDGGTTVLAIRQRLKMNQRTFAKNLGISFTTVSKIERGHFPVSVEIARKCLELLKSRGG